MPTQGRYLAFHEVVEIDCASFRILRNDRNTLGGLKKLKIPKTYLELFYPVGIFLPCNTLIYKDISKKFQNSKFCQEGGRVKRKKCRARGLPSQCNFCEQGNVSPKK